MTSDDDLRAAVELLPGWLPRQYWFAGDTSAGLQVRVASATLLADGDDLRLWHVLIEATQPTGSDIYQVPLSIRRWPVDRLDHVHVGHVDAGHVYDALHDKDATAILLRCFHDPDRYRPALHFHVGDDVELPVDEPSLMLSGEHRNANLAYGDTALLKVFRHVVPGLNPDVEIHRALTDAGCDLVAPLFGWIDGSWTDSTGRVEEASLAMVREFLTTASDGWALATASVRDLYAEGDLHADEVGGDFAAEAYRLGMATARVHETMAEVLPTGTLGADGLAGTAEAMNQRLDTALGVVPELEPFAAELRKHYDVLRENTGPVAVQRIHGSLHLGQALRTVLGWKLIDFEGDAGVPADERRALYSPLRDIAHMMRSFDYAAQHLLVTDHPPEDPTHDQIAYRAGEWAQRNGEAFCAGYAAASQTDPRADADLLRAYETDQAVHEAMYEARYRPSWLPIPLAAIERLAEST
ncbi:hypothetical protein [Haloactinopolyspora sp.]|uniref:maltokinase N-terminal cap-like domain-containing protein n=1 Tax=Haloactinopolyspora sp. TaxID=1966353 RepID=UPI002634C27C|nr:hypothetical protein [Haloactinopolyspora sp.]